MGDILRRRGMMAVAGSSPSGPLYSFDTMSKTSSNNYAKAYTSNGNHFKFTGTRRGNETDLQFDKAAVGSTSTRDGWTTPMFSVSDGATVTMKLKNLNVTSNKSGYFNFILQSYETVSDSQRIVRFSSNDGNEITYTTSGISQGEEETTVVISVDRTAHYFGFYNYNASSTSQTYTIEFDLELYVDGVRYI